MAPRRAAAVSAATSISNAAAGPSKSQPATPSRGDVSTNLTKQGRKSQNGQQIPLTSATSSLPVIPPEPLSPIISRLRKMWKFAAICQFLFTFDEAFGMSGFETEALERDLDGTEKKVIPDLMRRLLYTLTLNRNIDEYNWEDHLRQQYLARHPDQSILGTVEVPFPWAGLPLRQKIETLHQACEWQLWDAERFRKLVKNEEDSHIWRIDPVGWDANNNTYWLFDDNRLWVQHPPPEPVKPKAPPKKSSKKAKLEAAAVKRAAAAAQKRKRAESKPKSTPTRSSTRTRTSSGAIETPVLKRGRTSARSSGRGDWEEIPPELLYSGENGVKGEDGDSELSDPPPAEDDEDVSMLDSVKAEGSEVQTAETSTMEVEDAEAAHETNGGDEGSVDISKGDDADVIGADDTHDDETQTEDRKEEEAEWIEFETIAVTKQEWEAISIHFAKSKHPDEKLLHQFLNAEVLPKVMADLAEVEKQKVHEAAMANRKRSSRIALKESEREEKERDRVARLKMEEKMAAIRAEESQKLAKEREEMDQAKIREERLREREDRMAAREREAIERAEREILERENRERMREMRKLKREQVLANGGVVNESEEMQQQIEQDDDSWELNCEVCGKAGINLDDTEEIVCCEKCLVWQHTDCWNAFDRQLGRPRRDWENVDFYCTKCKSPAAGEPWPPAVARKRHQEEVAKAAREQQQQQRVQSSQRADGSPYQDPAMQQLHYQQRPQVFYSQSPNQQQYYQQQQQQQQQRLQQQYPQGPYAQQPQYPTQQQRQYQAAPQQVHQYPQHSVQSSAGSMQAPIHQGQYGALSSPQQHGQSYMSQYPQQWQQAPLPQMQRPMHVSSLSNGLGNGYATGYHQRPVMMLQHNQVTPQHMQRPVPQMHSAQHQNQPQQGPPQQMSAQHGSPQQQRRPDLTMQNQQVSHGQQQPYPIPVPQNSITSATINGSRMDMPAQQAPQLSPSAVSRPSSVPVPADAPAAVSATSQANHTAVTAAHDAVAPREDSQPIKVADKMPFNKQDIAPGQSSSQVKGSPASPKLSPGLQRASSNQPSGSFPLRYATAKSPLSRPDDYNSPTAPSLSLGPSVPRASSPSPKSHQRTPSNLGKQDPLFNRQSVTLNQSSSVSSGPGPSNGSLARKSPNQISGGASSSTVPQSGATQSLPSVEQQVSKSTSAVPSIADSGVTSSSTNQQGQSNTSPGLSSSLVVPSAAIPAPIGDQGEATVASTLPDIPADAPAS